MRLYRWRRACLLKLELLLSKLPFAVEVLVSEVRRLVRVLLEMQKWPLTIATIRQSSVNPGRSVWVLQERVVPPLTASGDSLRLVRAVVSQSGETERLACRWTVRF